MSKQTDQFKKVISHAKEYGFVFPSSEIYDGLSAVYDYAQNGVALKNNILVHTHTNGDEATELALDCLEGALAKYPNSDHRFTLQHCQLASTAQFKRMYKLGMCANLFSNQVRLPII